MTDRDAAQALEEQPFASSEMGESMDADLLPELSGGDHVVGRTDSGLTSGGCQCGSYCGIPSGQDVGDGS